jgi:hypothetical protein
MNIHLEALLRTMGVFLSVYFTVGWGRSSPPGYDMYMIIMAVILAIVLRFRGA